MGGIPKRTLRPYIPKNFQLLRIFFFLIVVYQPLLKDRTNVVTGYYHTYGSYGIMERK